MKTTRTNGKELVFRGVLGLALGMVAVLGSTGCDKDLMNLLNSVEGIEIQLSNPGERGPSQTPGDLFGDPSDFDDLDGPDGFDDFGGDEGGWTGGFDDFGY